jgi:hypothetical protein
MGGSRSRSEAVARAVAAREGCRPTEVEPPLYEVIDPGALDRLFGPTDGGIGARVTFRYGAYRIVVPANGEVAVEEPGDEETTVDGLSGVDGALGESADGGSE